MNKPSLVTVLQLVIVMGLSSDLLLLCTASPVRGQPEKGLGKFAKETPESFLQRYLNAVASAKSPEQLLGYMVPRDRTSPPASDSAEEKQATTKMLAAIMEMQHASTPRKVTVLDKQRNGDKVVLIVKAVEMNDNAGIDLHARGASVTGKVTLQKGPKGWLIANQFWHSDNGAGLTVNTGEDPDAPVVQSAASKYTDDIMAALAKVWMEPAPGSGQVTVELKNTSSGQFDVVAVKDKQGRADAEALVKSALNGIVLPPLPAEVAEQPIVNIQLVWSPRSKDTVKVVQLLNMPMLK